MRYLLPAICLLATAVAPSIALACEEHHAPLTTSPAPLDPNTPVQLTHVAFTVTNNEQMSDYNESLIKMSGVRGDYTLKNPTNKMIDMEFAIPAVLCEELDGKPDCDLDVNAPAVTVSVRGELVKPTRRGVPSKKGLSWAKKRRISSKSAIYKLTLAPGESAIVSLASSMSLRPSEQDDASSASVLRDDRWRHDMSGAAAWSGPVGELRLTMELLQRPAETHVPKQLKLDELRTVIGADKLHHTTIKLLATNIEPDPTFTLRWADLVPCHPYSNGGTAGAFFPVWDIANMVVDVKSDNAKWTGMRNGGIERDSILGAWLDNLYEMSADELATCRNSYYAHYGYSFKKAKYTKQFYKTPAVKGAFLVIGYTPDPGFQSKHISAVELAGAKIVKEVEALKRGGQLNPNLQTNFAEDE